MNKSELISAVASSADVSKRDAEGVINAFIDTVVGAVKKNDKVTLPGFGSFSQTQRKARTGRNPRTGEPVKIPAGKGAKFSAGASFKAAVSGKAPAKKAPAKKAPAKKR